jgi:hypothetical protein
VLEEIEEASPARDVSPSTCSGSQEDHTMRFLKGAIGVSLIIVAFFPSLGWRACALAVGASVLSAPDLPGEAELRKLREEYPAESKGAAVLFCAFVGLAVGVFLAAGAGR